MLYMFHEYDGSQYICTLCVNTDTDNYKGMLVKTAEEAEAYLWHHGLIVHGNRLVLIDGDDDASTVR